MKECDLRINPGYALGFADIRLPLENTFVTLQRLQLPGLTSPPPRAKLMEPPPLARCADWFILAFGFETGPSFLASTVFQRQPDIGSNEASEMINGSIIDTAAANYYYYYYYRGGPP
jgi:hypothetical protein